MMIDYQKVSNKVICVGKNYADHAKEMNSAVPVEPLLFLKPWTAVTSLNGEINIPHNKGQIHHELEIAYVIGKKLVNASESNVQQSIGGIGLALDLTLRDVQTTLKEKGFPWDKSKGFDLSCPIVCISTKGMTMDYNKVEINLIKNGQLQQRGNSFDMIFKTIQLISYMSNWFTLNAGDIILTGTPAGVGPIQTGDQLSSSLKMSGKEVLTVESIVV